MSIKDKFCFNFKHQNLETVFTLQKNTSVKGSILGVLGDQSTQQDRSAFEAVQFKLIPHMGVSVSLHCAFLKSYVCAFTY